MTTKIIKIILKRQKHCWKRPILSKMNNIYRLKEPETAVGGKKSRKCELSLLPAYPDLEKVQH